MRVVFWGSTYPEYEMHCPHWIGVKAGLKELGIDYLFLCCRSDKNYLKKTVEFKPDLIICGLPDPIQQFLPLENMRHKLPNAKIVFWYGDFRNERNNRLQTNCKGMLDAMFVSNDGQTKFWQDNLHIKNVYFLPLACERVRPVYNENFAFNAVFIGCKNFGGDFHQRAILINDLEKGGVKRIDSQVPELRSKIYQTMPLIYASSKIVLDISHYTTIQGYTSVRYWEIPAMHGFGLTKRFPGCEEFYPESMRVYWDDTAEALDKMKYYLVHEDERMAMVEKAYRHAKNHTHAVRFREMFTLLDMKI